MSLLSIVVPVYNEENTIYDILLKINNVNLVNNIKKEIIIINDGSTDKSNIKILEFISNYPTLDINYIALKCNSGKGKAIRTGFKLAKGNLIIIQDSDLEYDPDEYNLLLMPIVDGHADIVFGSRFMSGNPRRIFFFGNQIGNKFLTFLVNLLYNLNLSDVLTGYKLFKSEIIKNSSLSEDGFGIETEITMKIAKTAKVRIYEVGISYFGRDYKEGKKIKNIDFFKILLSVFKQLYKN